MINKFLVAAIIARSNFGLDQCDSDMLSNPERCTSLGIAINYVFGNVIEDETMYAMFFEEAEMWFYSIELNTEAEILEKFSHHSDQIKLCILKS